MAWAGIYLLKKYILTKSMSISYLKPVTAGSEIVLRGFILQEISKREIEVGAEIYNSSGDLCVTGKGNLVLFSKDSFHRLKLTSPEFLETFEKHVFLD
jgi:acyl-CoA thioesterase FadM